MHAYKLISKVSQKLLVATDLLASIELFLCRAMSLARRSKDPLEYRRWVWVSGRLVVVVESLPLLCRRLPPALRPPLRRLCLSFLEAFCNHSLVVNWVGEIVARGVGKLQKRHSYEAQYMRQPHKVNTLTWFYLPRKSFSFMLR